MTTRGTAFAFTGALTGSLLGLLDPLLGQGNGAENLGPGSTAILLLYSSALMVLPAVLCSLVAWQGIIVAQKIYSLEIIKRVFSKPLFKGCLVIGAIIAVLLMWLALRAMGIQLEAIDYQPIVMFLFAVVGCSVLAIYLPPKRRALTIITVVYCTASLGIATAGTLNVGNSTGVIETMETKTSLAKFVFKRIRSCFDSDDDGFSRVVCETDCDCNDGNPAINPVALEIPGNGLDEDCSGSDLLVADLAGKSGVAKEQEEAGSTSYHLKTPYNIVLITVDAMRADHLHSYGYERVTTPFIDRLAAENVMFQEVRSQGPSTRHVFPVLLTGQYFSKLNLRKGKKWSKLLGSNTTFAERLKEKNYTTRAVLPYFRFKEHSGFSQGFDTWENIVHPDRNPVWDPTGDLVTDRGIAHLGEMSKESKPWFLWLHYFDPHGSYIKHEGMEQFGTSKADRYDGELLFVDKEVTRLMSNMKKLGVMNNTVVVLTSDHGEGLGLPNDHGLNYHGFSLFDTEIRIPLIVKMPGAVTRKVKQSVGLLDIPPTIMELAGIELSKDLDGVSLVPYFFGKDPVRKPFLSELPEERPLLAIIEWPYKLIWAVRPNRHQLFDLEKDPLETSDLSTKEPAITSRLVEELKRQRVKKAR